MMVAGQLVHVHTYVTDIKLAYYFNDRYLSTEDSEFVELVKADIDLFVQSDQLDL